MDRRGLFAYHPRMLLRRYGTFTGGIDLPDEKHATLNAPIGPCGHLDGLRVPLAPCGGHPAAPLVETGQYVTAGEVIAEAADGRGVDIFAPLSGRVASVTAASIAAGDEFSSSAAIELADVSEPVSIRPLAEVLDWRATSAATLLERLAEGGVTTYHRPIVPLTRWIEKARRARCRILIANAMEAEPYVTADHRLLAEQGVAVIRGLAMLARTLQAQEIILAVDHRRVGEYRRLVGPARNYGISRVALPHKYPAGAAAMLVKVLTRKEVPLGGSAMDAGAAVIDPATCFAAYRWIACGAPPTGRVVTVAGERVAEPGNVWAPFGASCAALADAPTEALIHGGPMTALRCSEGAVVCPSTNAVLAVNAAPQARPGPCIRCGWCTDHCPARLNVAALNDMFEHGAIEDARAAGAQACVECGVCSYVCPSRLPLSQRVRRLKRAIAHLRRRMPLFTRR